jgi:hypothetical protein
MKMKEKIALAKALRDLAMAALKRGGKWKTITGARGDLRIFFCDTPVKIAYAGPFQGWANDTPEIAKHFQAVRGKAVNLPHSLDVWSGKKVLNVEWSDGDAQFEVIAFRRGDWEALLLDWEASWRVLEEGSPPIPA